MSAQEDVVANYADDGTLMAEEEAELPVMLEAVEKVGEEHEPGRSNLRKASLDEIDELNRSHPLATLFRETLGASVIDARFNSKS